MTLGEIMDAFRDRVGDTVVPYLWSDENVMRYASDAQREAAIRGRLIRDSSTAAIRSLAILAGNTSIALSPLVLDVIRARLNGVVLPLTITTVDQMDADDCTWESRASTTPTHLVIEGSAPGLKGRLWPTPVANVTVLLTVIRLPLVDLTDGDETPEIPAKYHERLIDWMERCAYLKKDAETLDKEASEAASSRFASSFGAFEDANVYRKQADKRPHVVHFNPF